MKYPAPPSGTGFVIVAVGAVVAALGVIQVEVQGLTENTLQMTGIRTTVRSVAVVGRKDGVQARSAPQERAQGLLPVVNETTGK